MSGATSWIIGYKLDRPLQVYQVRLIDEGYGFKGTPENRHNKAIEWIENRNIDMSSEQGQMI